MPSGHVLEFYPCDWSVMLGEEIVNLRQSFLEWLDQAQ